MKRELRYLAVGDSLTVGYGAPEGCGFVDLYHAALEERLDANVYVLNAGVNGDTSGQILERLRKDRELRQFAKTADVVTVTAGGNDLIQAAKMYFMDSDYKHLIYALMECKRNLEAMVALLRKLKGTDSGRCVLRVAELYNPAPDFEDADQCVRRYNAGLRKIDLRPAVVARVYDSFGKEVRSLLYDDMIHPNEAGYRRIAAAFVEAGFAPLTPN